MPPASKATKSPTLNIRIMESLMAESLAPTETRLITGLAVQNDRWVIRAEFLENSLARVIIDVLKQDCNPECALRFCGRDPGYIRVCQGEG